MYSLDSYQQFLCRLPSHSQVVCLGTLFSIKGSAYSYLGRRMLVSSSGHTLGNLSGGCIENTIINQSKEVISHREPKILEFNTTEDDDLIFGFNMGCRGIIKVLLQPVDLGKSNGSNSLPLLLTQSSIPVRYAVILAPLPYLGHTFLAKDEYINTLGHHTIPQELVSIVKAILAKPIEGSGTVEPFPNTELLIGTMKPTKKIKIYGASPCAGILYQLAKISGFCCEIYDHRQTFIDNFTQNFGQEVSFCYPDQIRFCSEANDAWIIMSHNYELDLKLVSDLDRTPISYLGIVGSKEKYRIICSTLKEKGQRLNEERIFSPAGLNTGGRSPEEIALSILAEIQTHLSKNKPYHLRDRDQGGSIQSSKLWDNEAFI